jgi:hypothetical protein
MCNFKWFYMFLSLLFLSILFLLFYVIHGILDTTHMHVKSWWCNTSQHDKHCSVFTWGLNVWLVIGTWKWFIKIETCCTIEVHVIYWCGDGKIIYILYHPRMPKYRLKNIFRVKFSCVTNDTAETRLRNHIYHHTTPHEMAVFDSHSMAGNHLLHW